MSEEKEKSPAERFVLQLIDVKPEEVTLKLIFDNIRNYGIAATIMVAGFYLLQHGSLVNHFPGAGVVFGVLLIVVGLILYSLNLTQVIFVFVKLKMRFVFYFIFSMTVFLGTLELLWVLIRQFIQKS